MAYKTLEDTIGNTPLVQLTRLPGADAVARNNIILGKLEGNNPAGSVKDRAAMSMLKRAEERGDIKPGDTLIEATSGNTGIALAMAAALRGYKMLLLMPENLSIERRQSMAAYGAQIMLTPKTGGMEYARDMAEQLQKDGKGVILDQFGNQDNARAHYEGTGPEIWRDTWTRSRRCRRRRPNAWRAGWRRRKVSFAVFRRRAPVRSRCAFRRRSRTRPSCSSCATGATAICRPAYFRRKN